MSVPAGSPRPPPEHAILVVDDEPVVRRVLSGLLGSGGHRVLAVASAEEARRALEDEDVAVVLTDMMLPGEDGISLCQWLAKERDDVPVILVTGASRLESAVAALRAGAYDFIVKPVDQQTVLFSVARALEHRSMREEVRRLRQPATPPEHFEELVGESAAMREVYALMERIADADVTVLVTGESGTGKELVATALHRRSRRAEGPFVAVNCAALSETLLESELFGHTKGAFTDARQASPGLLVRASGGTLFLDEIGDMALSTQVKLLRALQERRVRPVGGTTEIAFDVRVIGATNQDLEELVRARRFREDLFFRLDVVRIHLPPLRARDRDVLLLAHHLLGRLAVRLGKPVRGFSQGASERLLAYPFPGNVRELSNCVEHALALASTDLVAEADLPPRVRASLEPSVQDEGEALLSLEEVERRHIARVLGAVSGNRTRAAAILGIDRTTLARKLRAG